MGIDAFDLEVTPERGTPCALVAPGMLRRRQTVLTHAQTSFSFQGDLFIRLSSLMKDLFVLVEGRMNME